MSSSTRINIKTSKFWKFKGTEIQSGPVVIMEVQSGGE